MALERTYTVPLRKEWLKTPKYKRAKKAISAIRNFLKRHMKSEEIKIGKHLNLEIWKHGIKNPPAKIRINAIKDDKNIVAAELYGAPVEKKEEKRPKKIKEKVKEALKAGVKGEEKETKEEVRQHEVKEVPKREIPSDIKPEPREDMPKEEKISVHPKEKTVKEKQSKASK